MKELPRRLWHIFAGLTVASAGLVSPQDIFLRVLVGITIAALVLDIVRLMSPWVNRHFMTIFGALLRKNEISKFTGGTYFLLAACVVFILCNKSIAATALAFVAAGDPIAGIVGERWGKPRVSSQEQKTWEVARSWRNLRFRRTSRKSWEGSLACLGACLVVGVVFAAVTDLALWVVVVGAISATVIEFLSLVVNDNLTVPLVAAGVMSLVSAVVV